MPQDALPKKLVIATRQSRLALWQAEYVGEALKTLHPDLEIELLKIKTKGDRILDKTLSKIGGKGLFIKELEQAILDGRADAAVHSLKDVPVDMPEGFEIAAVLKRAEYRDAFISNRFASLSEMPAGAVVGTSSLRRESQIRARYPQLIVKPLRGNLDTRLSKLDDGQYDAIILAACGLQRMGMEARIRAILDIEESLPAVGQGALAIETAAMRPDLKALFSVLECPQTTSETLAERFVSKALGGSCQVPLAVFAFQEGDHMTLRARVAMPDGSRLIGAERSGDCADAMELAQEVVDELISKGAMDIVSAAGEL